ncbi:MAG: hypothetical protein AAF555_09810 [Verrucomicrobiota bacterium]
MVENPYEVPKAVLQDTPTHPLEEYGGIGRRAFLLADLGIGFLQFLSFNQVSQEASFLVLSLLFASFSMVPVYHRMKNIGRNPWWCWFVFLPLVGFAIRIPCLVFPEGFSETRRLDRAGRVTLVLLVSAFLLVLSWVLSIVI